VIAKTDFVSDVDCVKRSFMSDSGIENRSEERRSEDTGGRRTAERHQLTEDQELD
jgi:hypothetical protein